MKVFKERVLFICTGNSARSQMAEGILRKIAGDRYIVYSAGTDPRDIHPLTIEVMKEIDVDVKRHTPKRVEDFIGQEFDYVITVCDRAKERCPAFPGAVPIQWGFDDPAEVVGDVSTRLREFRKVRDEITRRIRLWILATHGPPVSDRFSRKGYRYENVGFANRMHVFISTMPGISTRLFRFGGKLRRYRVTSRKHFT